MSDHQGGWVRRVVMMMVLIAGLLGGQALAQGANPLDRDGSQPDPAGGGPGTGAVLPGAMPGGGPGAARQPITVPDFIKPGARLIYTSMMTLEPKPGQNAQGTTDGATNEFCVVAVLPDRVLFQVRSYVTPLGGQREFILGGASTAVVTATEINTGGTLWMDPKALTQLQSGPNIQILRGPFQLHNRNYDTTRIKIDTHDSTTITYFDSGTGLMLSMGSGVGNFRRSGPQLEGLNREIQNSLSYEAYRAVELPWHNSKRPAWTDRVGTLVYRGSMRYSVSPAAVDFTSEVKITERGDDWAAGTVTLRVPQQPANESTFVQGPGSPDGYWIDAQVLRNMRPGVIDRSPFLGTTLRYDVQDGPMGRMGVLTSTSLNGNQTIVSAYSLEDGALMYGRIQQTEPMTQVTTTYELSLAERRPIQNP